MNDTYENYIKQEVINKEQEFLTITSIPTVKNEPIIDDNSMLITVKNEPITDDEFIDREVMTNNPNMSITHTGFVDHLNPDVTGFVIYDLNKQYSINVNSTLKRQENATCAPKSTLFTETSEIKPSAPPPVLLNGQLRKRQNAVAAPFANSNNNIQAKRACYNLDVMESRHKSLQNLETGKLSPGYVANENSSMGSKKIINYLIHKKSLRTAGIDELQESTINQISPCLQNISDDNCIKSPKEIITDNNVIKEITTEASKIIPLKIAIMKTDLKPHTSGINKPQQSTVQKIKLYQQNNLDDNCMEKESLADKNVLTALKAKDWKMTENSKAVEESKTNFQTIPNKIKDLKPRTPEVNEPQNVREDNCIKSPEENKTDIIEFMKSDQKPGQFAQTTLNKIREHIKRKSVLGNKKAKPALKTKGICADEKNTLINKEIVEVDQDTDYTSLEKQNNIMTTHEIQFPIPSTSLTTSNTTTGSQTVFPGEIKVKCLCRLRENNCEQRESISVNDGEIELSNFFRNMYQQTRRLTTQQQRIVKMSLLQAICEAEDMVENGKCCSF